MILNNQNLTDELNDMTGESSVFLQVLSSLALKFKQSLAFFFFFEQTVLGPPIKVKGNNPVNISSLAQLITDR